MTDSPLPDRLPLPFTLGRYQLTRWLGRGGMGVVYAARDERLGRDVAIKLIALLWDEGAVGRFWREARAAASVSHPHVCQIYEIDESPHGIYLAMELLEGESLEQRLVRGACSVPESVAHAVQLLEALQALHERGLVHRDVKPSNLFLTPHGAKLLDFGLARSIAGDTVAMNRTTSAALTQPGMIIGTPRYMAPEQVTGDPVDARTDLFSVGCVLFEMLAGHPPFDGNNVIDLLFAIINEHPPALQGSDAVVAVDRVIRRALAKLPAGRFAAAFEMAAALRAVDTSTTVGDVPQPVRAGFTPTGFLVRCPLLAPLREQPSFAPVITEARAPAHRRDGVRSCRRTGTARRDSRARLAGVVTPRVGTDLQEGLPDPTFSFPRHAPLPTVTRYSLRPRRGPRSFR